MSEELKSRSQMRRVRVMDPELLVRLVETVRSENVRLRGVVRVLEADLVEANVRWDLDRKKLFRALLEVRAHRRAWVKLKADLRKLGWR